MRVTVERKAGRGAVELRGDARRFFASTEQEVVLAGPSDSGKTVAACCKVHATCVAVAGAQCSIVRKVRTSLVGSVVKTFDRVLAANGGQCVRKVGGESPSRYVYPNGSAVWLGGLDDPGKVLSSERDLIYVNQCEELAEDDWEVLLTRASGRAAVVAHAQLVGDCNPGPANHWLLRRAKEGKLRMLAVTHRDNPTVYDASGALTPDGAKRMAALESLTGVRRKRLRDGLWATAEGAVYDFDRSAHVLVRPASDFQTVYLAGDEGYTNPAVLLAVGEDSDGRWHCFREFYRTKVVPEDYVRQARAWFQELGAYLLAMDESAAGLISSLNEAGVYTVGGKGRVIDGINAVQNRLKVQGDGRPRYTVDPGCLEHINEFESYVWAPDRPKDTPTKENDHSMDALRYLCDVVRAPRGSFSTTAGAHTGEREREDTFRADRISSGDF